MATPQARALFGKVPGSPVFLDFTGSSTPGSEQTMITSTVPTGKKRNLWQVFVVCRMEGKFKIMVGATVVGSGRTGAASPMAAMTFIPSRTAAAGDQVKLLFTARSGSPVVDLEGYIQASDEDV